MSQIYTYEEIAKHNSPDDTWIVIEGKVYDVSKFLDEHPGGEEIIFELAGTDATENFEDIGHSDDALKILKKMYIGDLDKASKPVKVVPKVEVTRKSDENGGLLVCMIGGICLAIAYYYLND
ncbi:Cyb5p NDAI_0F02730 [Naumovozyma dairenensis CBS 421]|uniref:Cytochrome b5 heme-binding domain-containing protein n=1 Tax=Naumovozyma dairenensis (strain ATCC 10597 / BCRC 20456 / CBS 421 / NBRC 0211 / NRRL Y-12639) TaxID=1071378 RepID=G0WCT0_NAUDC|nr:hypothetical protein NDAI_0F02730 [Naumovozyma dairenensis CBS 421]CCD25591.1 hypothetical protein NDAI_0F02730 [Naumovozyma dairenensis CBS 421]